MLKPFFQNVMYRMAVSCSVSGGEFGSGTKDEGTSSEPKVLPEPEKALRGAGSSDLGALECDKNEPFDISAELGPYWAALRRISRTTLFAPGGPPGLSGFSTLIPLQAWPIFSDLPENAGKKLPPLPSGKPAFTTATTFI